MKKLILIILFILPNILFAQSRIIFYFNTNIVDSLDYVNKTHIIDEIYQKTNTNFRCSLILEDSLKSKIKKRKNKYSYFFDKDINKTNKIHIKVHKLDDLSEEEDTCVEKEYGLELYSINNNNYNIIWNEYFYDGNDINDDGWNDLKYIEETNIYHNNLNLSDVIILINNYKILISNEK